MPHLHIMILSWLYYHGGERALLGYQLKEGEKLPKEAASKLCLRSFVVRGGAAQKSTNQNGWSRVGKASLDAFFGVSGKELTPMRWKFWKEIEVLC